MLKDVNVLSLTHFLQGPAAVQILADLGANVVKVEPLTGAWERHWSGANTKRGSGSIFFELANRNQRSLAIDLKNAAASGSVTKLLAWADVIVENFRPRVLDRLGLGFDHASSVNPDIVYCSCTGYGSEGPYSALPGQDLLAQAISGLAHMTPRGGRPVVVGSAVVDQHSATLAAVGILARLTLPKGQRGAHIGVDLLSSALDLQIEPLTYAANEGALRVPVSESVADLFHSAPYGVFKALDGWLVISAGPVEAIYVALNRPETLQPFIDADPFENRDEISDAIGRSLSSGTVSDWLHRLRAEKVWCAPVQSYDEVINDPQVAFNGNLGQYTHDALGQVTYLRHPVTYDGERLPLRMHPPLLGEHTLEVLAEIGLSTSEIDGLISSNAVKQYEPVVKGKAE